MRWRLLLEEYGPEIEYIKGPKNVAADSMSRLTKQGNIVDDVDAVLPFVQVDENIFPVHLKEIQAKQAKGRDLRQKIKENPSHFQKTVVEQVKVITYKDRIYVPKDLRKKDNEVVSPLSLPSW